MARRNITGENTDYTIGMKREYSSSATPPSSTAGPIESPQSSKKAKATPIFSDKKLKKTCKSNAANGEWTVDKRGAFMDRVIAAGYQAVDYDSLAMEVRLCHWRRMTLKSEGN